VAGVLAKSTRRDPADLPAEPERLLDSPTYDGFPIRPLYTGADALPEPSLPGQWPYVRGGDALRDVKTGWKVAEAFPANGSVGADESNGAVLVALTEGVSALVLRAGESGVPVSGLDRLLDGVFVDLVPVVLEISGAGAEFRNAADVLLALLVDLDDDQRSRLSVDLGADPLTAPLSARAAPEVADVVTIAAEAGSYHGGVRAITVDGPAFHNRGASASWELAGSIAAAVAYLRLLGDGGVETPDALRQVAFRLAADDDQFMSIAKFRAARQLWARVAEVVGEPEAGAATVHAVTSLPMMAQRDPWVTCCAPRWRRSRRAQEARIPCWSTPSTWRSPVASPAPQRVSRAGSLETPNCCYWRNPTSGGCSTPPADPGSSRISPVSWPNRHGRTSRTSSPVAVSPKRATTSPVGSRRWPVVATTTSRTDERP